MNMNDHGLGSAPVYIGQDDIFSLRNLRNIISAPGRTSAAPASQGPLIQSNPIKTEFPYVNREAPVGTGPVIILQRRYFRS